MTTPFRICALEELPDPGSLEFVMPGREEDRAGFVVRHGDAVRAYRNRCPHTGASLNWLPDQFLELEGKLIQCATHGALFRPEDGRCIRGPCVDQSLEALPVKIENGIVWLEPDS
jgi:nitrite reductase/ring-hydroxylating ferredoxin subunit